LIKTCWQNHVVSLQKHKSNEMTTRTTSQVCKEKLTQVAERTKHNFWKHGTVHNLISQVTLQLTKTQPIKEL
jgi:hypothetical protein